MKLQSAPLDDVYNELRFTLEQDSSLLARTLLRLFGFLYRSLHGLMLLVLRCGWRLVDRAHGGR